MVLKETEKEKSAQNIEPEEPVPQASVESDKYELSKRYSERDNSLADSDMNHLAPVTAKCDLSVCRLC